MGGICVVGRDAKFCVSTMTATVAVAISLYLTYGSKLSSTLKKEAALKGSGKRAEKTLPLVEIG